MEAIADEEAADLRAKLGTHLRTLIDRIEVFPVGFKVVADREKDFITEPGEAVQGRNGRMRRRPAKRWWKPHVETIVETLGEFWSEIDPRPPKKQCAAFGRYVLRRRMSKEGRFYRVQFKTGERVDLVPPDGLATGWKVVKGSVEQVLPDFGALWTGFQAGF